MDNQTGSVCAPENIENKMDKNDVQHEINKFNNETKDNYSSYENISSKGEVFPTTLVICVEPEIIIIPETRFEVSLSNTPDNNTLINNSNPNDNNNNQLNKNNIEPSRILSQPQNLTVEDSTNCASTTQLYPNYGAKKGNNIEHSNSDKDTPSESNELFNLIQRQKQRFKQRNKLNPKRSGKIRSLNGSVMKNNIEDLKQTKSVFNDISTNQEEHKRTSSYKKRNHATSAETSQVEADTYLSLEENLDSLDKTIKKCYLQLNKKLCEAASNYVPNTSVVRFACKSPLRTEKVLVFIRVVFLKIGEIDTMKENFTADAFIQARWREPALDGMTSQNPDDIDWSKFWNPKIYIENSFSEPKETIWQTLSFNSKEEATVFERRRIRGCFIENLELDEFPFDTQDLTLTIATERSETELELEEDTDEISSINVQSFVDEQEWKLHSHVETWKKITTKAYQNSKAKHPSFSTSCRATRRPGFFIWNIFLVMLFICSLTFSTFCVDLMKPENRLQLSFILLLTTITFKFVVSQTLPRISYLTYLDKYILISMAILCGVCVWHALVFSFFRNNLDLARAIDRWALIISGSSYFLFHVFFFSCIYLVALKKQWKYDKKDKEHKERIKRLQRLQELVRTNFALEENTMDADDPEM